MREKADSKHEPTQLMHLGLIPFNREAQCSSCGKAHEGGGLCASCVELRQSWDHTQTMKAKRGER